MRGGLAVAAHFRATTEGRPHPALRATFPPEGGRLLAEASPHWGKLSPKVTDEGRVAVAAHLPGNNGRSAPHPALRATAPLLALRATSPVSGESVPEGEGF